MTPLEVAQRRLEVLRQLEQLSPPESRDRPDIQALQQVIRQREALFAEWPRGSTDGDEPELRGIRAEIRGCLQRLLDHDQRLIQDLSDARSDVLRSLRSARQGRRVATKAPAPALVRRRA